MAHSATAKRFTRPSASFVRRYGLAFASVTGALLLELLFHHFNLPHPFAAFALSASAITFWYGGTRPGIVAVLLSSLIRGLIFESETSSLSRVLYELVFLTFAILMIWVRRRREALEARSRTELQSSSLSLSSSKSPPFQLPKTRHLPKSRHPTVASRRLFSTCCMWPLYCTSTCASR
jgi:hypothetical protein